MIIVLQLVSCSSYSFSSLLYCLIVLYYWSVFLSLFLQAVGHIKAIASVWHETEPLCSIFEGLLSPLKCNKGKFKCTLIHAGIKLCSTKIVLLAQHLTYANNMHSAFFVQKSVCVFLQFLVPLHMLHVFLTLCLFICSFSALSVHETPFSSALQRNSEQTDAVSTENSTI